MENQKWLEAQRLADYERAVGDKQAKQQSTDSYIRSISRRGTYNTVTFSDTDCMPSVITGNNDDIVPLSKVSETITLTLTLILTGNNDDITPSSKVSETTERSNLISIMWASQSPHL
jgi:hypothetical protein